MAAIGTLMSNNIDDCIADSNVPLSTKEMEYELKRVANGESGNEVADGDDSASESANDIVDDECMTDEESEVALINEGINRLNTDDGSLSPSTTGEMDTSISATSDQNDKTGKSRSAKKPVKRFSPFRNNQLNRAHWNSSCKIGSSSSNSSGETSEDGSAPPKKVCDRMNALSFLHLLFTHYRRFLKSLNRGYAY
jgi:hypothetical protein